mgnify:FL=1
MDNFNSGRIKEMVYDVLQNPTRENFIDILDNGLGEQDNLDFKVQWIEAQKLAEILLGIANSGGGAIILGVKENEDGTLESIGLSKIEDKEKIHSKMAKFLPETIKFEIADFDFSNESYSKLKGRLFQLILIYSEDINLPYIWEKDSNSAEAGSIFFRRGTKTVKANSYEINEMLDKRLEATYVEQSSLHLEEHLKQLNTLYKNMSSQMYSSSVISNLFKNMSAFGTLAGTPQNNPYYPKESYDEFIAKMIEKKKMKIEKVLDLK